jgi:dUTP pyrophosphatase
MAILRIKKLVPGMDTPLYSREGDCGIDLRASGTWIVNLDDKEREVIADELAVKPGERIIAKTGLALEVPPGHWGNVRDRSGHARKLGLHTLSGVLDENYRGEVQLVLVNLSKKPCTIMKNERIAQLIITPYTKAAIEVVDELSETDRGAGGFGSSGKN